MPEVREYPADKYSAYWETIIELETGNWVVRIISRDTGEVLLEQDGIARTYSAALKAADEFVKTQMEHYRRA